jgi:hypothetical protein
VFGSTGFKPWGHGKARLDGRLGDIEPWTIHDLRRTSATGMGELEVEPWIIESVLNHISGHKAGVAGTYNRARHLTAMRKALTLWADRVESIVTGKPAKVEPLRKAA